MNMNRALVEQQGASGAAILKNMAEKNWAKVQDTQQYDYGVKQFDADYDSNIPFLITVEGLGLSLLLIYNNSRKDRTDAQKKKANQQASENSDARVKGWRDIFAAKTGTSAAYTLLSADIKRQTQTGTPSEPPTPKTPLIRSLVRNGKSKWGDNKNGEITLDGCFLDVLKKAGPMDCWVPVRRSNPRVEWKYSFNASTGRWTMSNAMFPTRIGYVLFARHHHPTLFTSNRALTAWLADLSTASLSRCPTPRGRRASPTSLYPSKSPTPIGRGSPAGQLSSARCRPRSNPAPTCETGSSRGQRRRHGGLWHASKTIATTC